MSCYGSREVVLELLVHAKVDTSCDSELSRFLGRAIIARAGGGLDDGGLDD